MRSLWIGTSWKMNKTAAEARTYVATLKTLIPPSVASAINLFIIPPFTALSATRESIGDWPLKLGAQNMHWAEEGAYTGEISAAMLNEFAIDLVELGHSERRTLFGETDADLNRKVKAALAQGLRPLLCVGDDDEEFEAGASAEAAMRQIRLAFAGLDDDEIGRCLVAYEPIWAIGETGVAATPEHVQYVHSQLHEALHQMTTHPVPVLYGGSVREDNALVLLNEAKVDGLFIGRAAWQPEGLAVIAKLARSIQEPLPVPAGLENTDGATSAFSEATEITQN